MVPEILMYSHTKRVSHDVNSRRVRERVLDLSSHMGLEATLLVTTRAVTRASMNDNKTVTID